MIIKTIKIGDVKLKVELPEGMKPEDFIQVLWEYANLPMCLRRYCVYKRRVFVDGF